MRQMSHAFLSLTVISLVSIQVAGFMHTAPLVSFSALPSSRHVFGFPFQENAEEITNKNWQQHPKIKAVRAVVQAVKAGLSKNSFTVKRRAFEYCEPYEDTARTIATDSKGVVRFYQNEGGSDDSSLKWEHYYDERGQLRFVFITGGAVNGSRLEHRIYFDEAGKRIWEEHVYKKGPGYTFPDVWPDEQLQIKDAAAKFSSKSNCPEAKRKRK